MIVLAFWSTLKAVILPIAGVGLFRFHQLHVFSTVAAGRQKLPEDRRPLEGVQDPDEEVQVREGAAPGRGQAPADQRADEAEKLSGELLGSRRRCSGRPGRRVEVERGNLVIITTKLLRQNSNLRRIWS